MDVFELIDKYIPTKTKAEWLEMVGRYEAEITSILERLHRAHEQIESLCEHLHGLETEYGHTYVKAFPMGSVRADMFTMAETLSKRCIIEWRPDPYRTTVEFSPMTPPGEYPHLLGAAARTFEKAVTEHLRNSAASALSPLLGETMKGLPPYGR